MRTKHEYCALDNDDSAHLFLGSLGRYIPSNTWGTIYPRRVFVVTLLSTQTNNKWLLLCLLLKPEQNYMHKDVRCKRSIILNSALTNLMRVPAPPPSNLELHLCLKGSFGGIS